MLSGVKCSVHLLQLAIVQWRSGCSDQSSGNRFLTVHGGNPPLQDDQGDDDHDDDKEYDDDEDETCDDDRFLAVHGGNPPAPR